MYLAENVYAKKLAVAVQYFDEYCGGAVHLQPPDDRRRQPARAVVCDTGRVLGQAARPRAHRRARRAAGAGGQRGAKCARETAAIHARRSRPVGRRTGIEPGKNTKITRLRAGASAPLKSEFRRPTERQKAFASLQLQREIPHLICSTKFVHHFRALIVSFASQSFVFVYRADGERSTDINKQFQNWSARAILIAPSFSPSRRSLSKQLSRLDLRYFRNGCSVRAKRMNANANSSHINLIISSSWTLSDRLLRLRLPHCLPSFDYALFDKQRESVKPGFNEIFFIGSRTKPNVN